MKTHRKLKKPVFITLIVLCVALAATIVYLLWPKQAKQDILEITPIPVVETTPEPVATPDFLSYTDETSINPEYIGEVKFTSGLIDENVVQASDNDKYFATSWDLQSSSHGAAFMDYRNTLSDKNIIIYGHFVYADESLMFSPLHALKEEANYEENKYIDLALSNETRRYQVTDVYYYEMDNPNLEFFHTNYDPTYFDTYYKSIKEKEFYDTGVTITADDSLLTLQTCVRDREDLRLIIVAKEIEKRGH